jgi:hypothetical protein
MGLAYGLLRFENTMCRSSLGLSKVGWELESRFVDGIVRLRRMTLSSRPPVWRTATGSGARRKTADRRPNRVILVLYYVYMSHNLEIQPF